jgi:hypothetical protein
MSFTPIASQTVSSSATSITFSSIPGSFRDLVLIAHVATASGSNSNLQITQINGSASAGSVGTFQGDSSATKSVTSTNMRFFPTDNTMPDSAFNSNSPIRLEFFDYAQTNKLKTVLAVGGGSFGVLWHGSQAMRFDTLGAITSITLGASFGAGSTLSLYGIAG